LDPVEPVLYASLSDLIDQGTFGEVCRSFYDLFEVPVRVFDGEGNLLVETSHTLSPCAYLNRFESTRSRCTVVRSKVKMATPETPELEHIYCFSGLGYAMAPISFQNELLGKIVLGPYRPSGLDRLPDGVADMDDDLDPGTLGDKISDVRRVSSSALARIMNAMRAVIDVILFSSHKSHITNQIYLASVQESYREMSEKNRKLEAVYEEMKAFERLKANFLAMVSHELRTPLTSIIGYSDMLFEGIAGDLAEEQKQFVSTIKAKGDELLGIISSILDFSQIDSGHLVLELAETDVEALLRQTIERNEPSARRRGVRLSLSADPDVPRLELDPDKIRVAVGHLVDNAIKFSAPESVIKISARVVPSTSQDGDEDGAGFVLMASPDMLEIAVEDRGAGIRDGELERIFSPFTQLDDSSTREHGGAGLGLAIVKHYVEAHGGRVHVKSREGEGSEFTVRIPVTEKGGGRSGGGISSPS